MSSLVTHSKRVLLPATVAFMLLASCSGNVNSLVKKGNKKEAEGHYADAIEYYKQALAKGASKERMNLMIANCYRVTNKIQEATPFYAAAIESGTKDDKSTFYYAQGLKAMGKYADAQVNFNKYAQSGSNENLAKLAELEVKNIDKINTLLQKETRFSVKPLENDVNTEGPEYAPVLFNNNLYYTASNNQFKYSATGSGFTDIYQLKFDGSNEQSGAKTSLNNDINKNTFHEACPTFAPDGSFMIFARSNDGKKAKKNSNASTDTDLFLSRFKNGDWSTPEKLSISDPKSWESSPLMSSDGKTLYFASNRKGGVGGIDLYKATHTGNGQFTEVVNLGEKINTAGNEMFPTFSSDGKLQFSSDGHAGLGALDIFEFDAKTGKVNNLGSPVNSSADDFGLIYKDSLSGYMVSNRAGGKGDDDIYTFKKKPVPIPRNYNYKLNVSVNTPNFKTKKKKPVEKAHIKFEDVKGSVLKEAYTDAKGVANVMIDSTQNYQVIIDREGFFTYKEKFSVKGAAYSLDSLSPKEWHKVLNDTMTITMKKIKLGEEIVLENIYYDYNSAEIREDAKPDLNLLIDFMKENPSVKVQIGSHTDSRGNKKYNLKLSENRAKAAVAYIVSNGIDASKVKAKGYGDTNHIVKNAQTEEEHQKNRRTEFKVIEIAK